MVTDWILDPARRRTNSNADLRGGRVTDAGLLDDGRFGIQIGGRRKGGRRRAGDRHLRLAAARLA